MKRNILTLSLGIGAILLSTQHVLGQSQNCANHDTVVARLAETYGETRQSMGLGRNNTVIEVFASDETGSWTITVTNVNGVTCLVSSGQAYEALTEEIEPASANDA